MAAKNARVPPCSRNVPNPVKFSARFSSRPPGSSLTPFFRSLGPIPLRFRRIRLYASLLYDGEQRICHFDGDGRAALSLEGVGSKIHKLWTGCVIRATWWRSSGPPPSWNSFAPSRPVAFVEEVFRGMASTVPLKHSTQLQLDRVCPAPNTFPTPSTPKVPSW